MKGKAANSSGFQEIMEYIKASDQGNISCTDVFLSFQDDAGGIILLHFIPPDDILYVRNSYIRR